MEINQVIYTQGILFDSQFLIVELLEEKNELIYKTKTYGSSEDYSEEKKVVLVNNEFKLEHFDGHFSNERIITLENVHQLHSLKNKH